MLHTLLFCTFILALGLEQEGQTNFFAASPGSTLAKYDQFMSSLTSGERVGPRYVHSSGGAAGGVISEGQGYGVFAAATTAAIVGPSNTRYPTILAQAYGLFLGWKQMCMKSTSDGCQNPRFCTSGGSTYPCLPHWKFSDSLSEAYGTGSAPDGDEDAILGMIILARLTASSKPAWWTEVATWAYQSCKQFYISETVQGGSAFRIVKLGACWGGWDCQNPSYHAPFAYKAMRDFMKEFGSQLGFADGADYYTKWNQVIDTTYAVLNSAQCPLTGLIPNWYVPKSDPSLLGTTSCSGSGTPSAEYGSEASRTVWRVALDYIWTGDSRSKAFLDRLIPHVADKFSKNADLSTGCLVNSIHSGWLNEAFMYGPTLTALVKPHASVANQQTLVTNACTKLSANAVTNYYSGSWTVLSLMILNGDIARISSIVTGAAAPVAAPVAAPKPVPVTVPVTAPKPVPVSVPVTAPKPVPVTAPVPASCTNIKYGDNPANNYFIVVAGAASTATVSVTCLNNVKVTCAWNADWKRHACQANTECKQARTAIVNGLACPLSPTVIAARLEDETTEPSTPLSGPFLAMSITLIVLGVVIISLLILALILLARRAPAMETV